MSCPPLSSASHEAEDLCGAQHSARLASRNGEPYVLCGDFNIKPGDSTYGLITTGSIQEGHPDIPGEREWDPWTPSVKAPMKSAYAEVPPLFRPHPVALIVFCFALDPLEASPCVPSVPCSYLARLSAMDRQAYCRRPLQSP